MKNFKKITALLICTLMCATVSCQTTEKPNEFPTESVSETEAEEVAINVATLFEIKEKPEKIAEKLGFGVDINLYKGEKSFESLILDILSGNQPDVVWVAHEDMLNLISNNYMADMCPLMEHSESLKKEDFLPNVISGLEKNGEIPALCPRFSIHTAVAKTANVGENAENWTVKEALDKFRSMPEDVNFLAFEHRAYDRVNYFLKRVSLDSVDYENSKCNFGGAFFETLGNVMNFPEFSDKNTPETDDLLNDRAIVEEVHIDGLVNGLNQYLYAYFGGEDITFVGYPSESGKGYRTEIQSMLGILGTSTHKSEAYEFIAMMINDDSEPFGIPVTEKLFNQQLNRSKYEGMSINAPVTLFDKEFTISEKCLNQTVEYIRGVEFEPYTSKEVDNIIREEYHKAFSGESTAQECTDMLNNRVNIYLNEHK
ncbi:MAG: ABC transporter substrate-binding protein [Ruminococcus sp.]|nr:ABC transporter substrate-binding protein [Ruminococcus sp.]